MDVHNIMYMHIYFMFKEIVFFIIHVTVMLLAWHIWHILFVSRCKINSECVTDGLQLVHAYIIVHVKILPKLCSYMCMWFIADHTLSQLGMQVCYYNYTVWYVV